MKSNKGILFVSVFVLSAAWLGWLKFSAATSDGDVVKMIHPRKDDIHLSVSTSGTVLPKNRLEVKPPVNGRIEQVLAKEGQQVIAGTVIAWMSSTERAALLDAARGQGEEKLKYWQEVYKPIPLTAPIDGEVIVGTVQPGQTVTTSDPVLVLSDRLIVRAQVDETDIGKIKEGQKAVVSLDAYPDTKTDAVVDHVYYESKTVNNVTMYEVDLSTATIPSYFRSGMNANVEFIEEERRAILTLPVNAVHKTKEGVFAMVSSGPGQKFERRQITVGISDDKKIEIVSGLSEDDLVVMNTQKYSLPQKNKGSNPFIPQRKR